MNYLSQDIGALVYDSTVTLYFWKDKNNDTALEKILGLLRNYFYKRFVQTRYHKPNKIEVRPTFETTEGQKNNPNEVSYVVLGEYIRYIRYLCTLDDDSELHPPSTTIKIPLRITLGFIDVIPIYDYNGSMLKYGASFRMRNRHSITRRFSDDESRLLSRIEANAFSEFVRNFSTPEIYFNYIARQKVINLE